MAKVLAIAAFIFTVPSAFTSDVRSSEILFQILNNSTYRKEVRPVPITNNSYSSETGNATIVTVNLYLRQIQSIDDLTMEITLQMTFRQYWRDTRLSYSSGSTEAEEYVTLSDDMGQKIWTPNLSFSNEVKSYLHSTFAVNSFKRVHPDGSVIWSTRMTVTVSCPMDFTYYPFDHQLCRVRISDYALTNKDLVIEWKGPMDVVDPEDQKVARFVLKGIEHSDCSAMTQVGKYSCLSLDFYLQRESSTYLLLFFLPTGMLVVLTWVSFWLGSAMGARLSLTLTILLTMTAHIQGTSSKMPQVSYTKAMDVWMILCQSYGVLSVLQNATVAFLSQRRQSLGITSSSGPSIELPLGVGERRGQVAESGFRLRSFLKLPSGLDGPCCVMFPGSFLIFTIIYVLVYVRY